MKAFTTAVALVLLAPFVTVRAADPTFTVTNKCDQFVVINRTTPVAPVAPSLPTDPSQPAPAGYEWKRYPGELWKLFPLNHSKAPEVAVPKGATFLRQQPRTGDGHQCPNCWRSQYTVDSFNRNGTHNHKCPVDGTVWSH